MLTYYTTGDLAAAAGVSVATARNRVRDNLWKPNARTRNGDALFTERRAGEIVEKETTRGRLPKGTRPTSAPAAERAE